MKPEGNSNYQVEPQLDIFPVAETKPKSNNAIGSDNVLEARNTEFIEELAMEVPENEGEGFESLSKKQCAFYKNSWFEGDIEYYNENICKYHVSFNDGSEDCIGQNDIDMIEAICSKNFNTDR